MRKSTLLVTTLVLSSTAAFADWRSDTGWDDLQAWDLDGLITLPDTSTVFVGIAEAEFGADNISVYSPDPGNTELTDVNITDVYNQTGSYSAHATFVARLFFGNSSSVSPDVANANVYGANRFLDQILNFQTSWSEDIMSHSYVGSFSTILESEEYSRALDYSTATANVLHISGANNNSTTILPHIWSHAYNNITVGRSDGQHSAGVVQTHYHGEGRQKPELVCPQTKTSYSTGSTASVATLLHALGKTHSSSNAVLPLTVKSCMLAGALKTKFPSWDNNTGRPIDEIYGAGEVNMFNSYRILNENESIANSSVNMYGWDHNSIPDTTPITYTFTVPSYASSASVSANLSWNRTVTRTRSGRSFTGSYDELANLSLTLVNNSDNDKVVFISNSSVDNLEHIWQPYLTPGTYTLSVSKSSGPTTNYVLAWRVDTETNHEPSSFVKDSITNTIGFDQLVPSHPYTLQRSTSLSTWADVGSTQTSSTTGTLSFDDPNAGLGEKVFYRLRYYTP